MTPSELAYLTSKTEPYFFSRETMKFFGDTMGNYGARKSSINTDTENNVPVWELYCKRPVRHGLKSSAFFRQDDFKRVFPKEVK